MTAINVELLGMQVSWSFNATSSILRLSDTQKRTYSEKDFWESNIRSAGKQRSEPLSYRSLNK